MASLLERLEAREQAARTRLEALEARQATASARVEALRAEMDQLAEHLAAERELLGRLEITRQRVIEVLVGREWLVAVSR
jgi:putative heme degradation protein